MRHETDKSIEKQIALWGLLGPSLIIATLLVGFLYPVKPLILSTASFLALFCAWKWKISGLIPAAGFMVLGCLWQLHTAEPRLHLFIGIFSLSLTLALIVTAFSYDQVATQLCDLHAVDIKPKEASLSLNAAQVLLDQQAEQSQELYADLQCELQETRTELESLYLSGEVQHLQAQQQILLLQEQIQQLESFAEDQAAQHEEVYQELQYLQAWQNQKELDEKMRQMEIEEEESLIKEAWLANVHELSQLESLHAQDVDDLHGLIHNLITLQLEGVPTEEAPLAMLPPPQTAETILLPKASASSTASQPAKSTLKPTPKHQIKTTELKKPAKTKPQAAAPTATAKESGKAASKQKKTNVWANAILSRWSPPEEKKG